MHYIKLELPDFQDHNLHQFGKEKESNLCTLDMGLKRSYEQMLDHILDQQHFVRPKKGYLFFLSH